MAHQEVSRAKMDRLLQDVAEFAQVELGPRMEANILMAMLAPKKGAPKPKAGTQPAQSAPA
jgi:translation initiation factor IF-3